MSNHEFGKCYSAFGYYVITILPVSIIDVADKLLNMIELYSQLQILESTVVGWILNAF